MKEIKKVWKQFHYRECDALAAYLEEMALQGWHLETMGLTLSFRKGVPKKVRYEIEVFPKASEFDLKPEPDTEEFTEYCLKAGWEFVCMHRRFCVFRTEDPDVVPIETDELQRFKNIKKEKTEG